MFSKPILNMTIFTKGNHAPYGYRGLSPIISKVRSSGLPGLNRIAKYLSIIEVSRYRKKEDSCYFHSLNIPSIDLNLFDAPFRGYRSPLSVSNFVKISSDPAFKLIRSTILKLTLHFDKRNLVLPLGLGNHIDHVVVRNACRSLPGNYSLLYYEDLPYAADLDLEEIKIQAGSFDKSLEPHQFEVKEFFDAKLRNLGLYPTNVGKKEIVRTTLHARRLSSNDGECERLWYRRSKEPIGLEMG